MEKKFVNGFTSWSETFFLLTDHLSTEIIKDNARAIHLREGVGFIGLCPIVEEWADEFEERNKGRQWDGEFYDEIEEFFTVKLNSIGPYETT